MLEIRPWAGEHGFYYYSHFEKSKTMKHIIFLILSLLPLLAFSQLQYISEKMTVPEYGLAQNKIMSSKTVLELSWQEELQHTRYCLGNYRKEKLTGIWMTVGGGVLAGVSTGLYESDVIDSDIASIGYIAGGVSVITGYVLQITCNRWLKKAAIGPANSGIGVKVSF